MAIRQDLVASAVTFLKDPQVASAPLAKKIEFLESKELTSEEIQEALSRATGASTTVTPPPAAGSSVTPPPLPAYSYATYAQPPPLPKRDWRDYFVMATVSVGVTYGLYELARRYVVPLLVPPTPPALDTDKQALETEFARAQALLEQLAAETEQLKQSDAARGQKLDAALVEVEAAVTSVKEQVARRDEEMKLVKSQVENIRNELPKALIKHGEVQQFSLTELQSELKSLKHLVSTRIRVPDVTPVSTTPVVPGLSTSLGGATEPAPAAPAPVAPRPGIPAWQLASAGK